MSKKLFISFLIVVAIAAVILISKNKNVDAVDARINQPVMSVYSGDFDSVRFEQSGENFEVVLDETGRWFMKEAGYYMDSSKLFNLLEILNRTKISDLVSVNKESQKKFGLSDDSESIKTIALSKNGAAVVELKLGGQRDKGGQYIKFAGEDKTYLISTPISIQASAKDFMDLNIFRLEKNQLSKIDVSLASEKPYTIEKVTDASGDISFTVASGNSKSPTKADEINLMLASFTPLTFERLANEAELVLAAKIKPSTITMHHAAGSTLKLEVFEIPDQSDAGKESKGQEKKNNYFIKLDGIDFLKSFGYIGNNFFDGILFQIGGTKAQNFLKPFEKLKAI